MTGWLAKQLPSPDTQHLTGIDINPTLIGLAQKDFIEEKHLDFITYNVTHFADRDRYDFIYSFSTLHWIPPEKQVTTLTRIYQALKPGGQILLLVPLRHPILYDCIDTLAADEQWKDYFTADRFKNPRQFFEKETYNRFLSEAGFIDFSTRVETLDPPFYRFNNSEALKRFIRGWLPHLEYLPTTKDQERFLGKLVDNIVKEIKACVDGSVNMPLNYLRIQSMRPILQNQMFSQVTTIPLESPPRSDPVALRH